VLLHGHPRTHTTMPGSLSCAQTCAAMDSPRRRSPTRTIEFGHHMAEDNPDQLASILEQFLVS
jgi:hypothetical protein